MEQLDDQSVDENEDNYQQDDLFEPEEADNKLAARRRLATQEHEVEEDDNPHKPMHLNQQADFYGITVDEKGNRRCVNNYLLNTFANLKKSEELEAYNPNDG